MQIAKIGGLDRILNDHDDGMISKTILYITQEQMMQALNQENVCPYIDAECTVHVTAKDIVELVLKGCVVNIVGTGMWCTPMGVRMSDGEANVVAYWNGEIIGVVLQGVDEDE